jgi:hypothetical protein
VPCISAAAAEEEDEKAREQAAAARDHDHGDGDDHGARPLLLVGLLRGTTPPPPAWPLPALMPVRSDSDATRAAAAVAGAQAAAAQEGEVVAAPALPIAARSSSSRGPVDARMVMFVVVCV